ncbi:acyl carrier protein [Kitasatospora sp. MAP12-15]|uniref:acyl carrier protein n=1 Tax=unclassified Kitasatospora TaxID=2633591 RepID=UPI00247C2ED6|nr:acyl carrier protein [Kitasatospora sp. MAP12-44]
MSAPMHAETENAARENLALVLTTGVEPEEIDPDADLVAAYGLTSLNKVLFLTSLCDETGTELFHFTEHDLARMTTLREVVEAVTNTMTKAV